MWRIPLSDLNYDERESAAVQQVLDSGWLTMGPRTEEFEERFSKHHAAGKAVAVANCTCALDLVYRFVLQNSGAERRGIVVPDVTFVATANAVIAAGGTPILCDVETPDRPYISAAAVEELLATRMDIAAVVVMHYAGHDAGAERLAEICSHHDVALIEDCAHAPGARTPSGRPLGTIGLAGCFSFFSNKNLSTGEGGMIVTNDDGLADWARMARSHGVTSGTWARHSNGTSGYDVLFPGYNYRCTEITAALGLTQLGKLEDANKCRRELTLQYHQLLQSVNELNVLMPGPDQIENSACHILPLVCENAAVRERVVAAMTAASIQTSHHYPPIHTFSWYRDNDMTKSAFLANGAAFADREVTLPLHPKLSSDNVCEIVETLKNAIA